MSSTSQSSTSGTKIRPNPRQPGKPQPLDFTHIDVLIEAWLAEDLGEAGDITAQATIPEEITAKAALVVKKPGVVAGLTIFERVLKKVDSTIQFEALVPEGTKVDEVPKAVARIQGPSRALLAAERTALNILQRLSGIATVAREYSDLAAPVGIQILDTRKTTPGLRALEKWAVATGGGTNHRFGLFDAILIKDNHIAIAGGVTAAVRSCRTKFPTMPLEVEVTSLEQLKEALGEKAEWIMLDNMSPSTVKEAVQLIDGRAFTEISGGVTLQNLSSYLIPGVDAISIGALTHSVKSIDISLEVEER